MTTPRTEPSAANASRAFINEARRLLVDEYLPKIERSVEKLTDDKIWWRANEESNSIGNLMLHLSGNARQWIVCGLGGATDDRQRQREFYAREGVARAGVFTGLKTKGADAADRERGG